MNPALLEEARDVILGAGRPGERRAVVHQLSGHDERVPPLKLTVIPLAVMLNSEAAFKHKRTLRLNFSQTKKIRENMTVLRQKEGADRFISSV